MHNERKGKQYMQRWLIILLLAPCAAGMPLLEEDGAAPVLEPPTTGDMTPADADVDPSEPAVTMDVAAPELPVMGDVLDVHGTADVQIWSVGPDATADSPRPAPIDPTPNAEDTPSSAATSTAPWETMAGWAALIATILGAPAWLVFRRVAGALPFILGFSRLDKDDLLEQQTRRDIMEYVHLHPAASATQVMESQDIAWGTAVYHLRRLENAGFILSEREGTNRRFWDAVSPEARERRTTRVLRIETSQRIAHLLCREPDLSQADIRGRLRISAGATSQHLRRLQAAGFITSQRGNCIRYRPTDRLATTPMAS